MRLHQHSWTENLSPLGRGLGLLIAIHVSVRVAENDVVHVLTIFIHVYNLVLLGVEVCLLMRRN